MTPTRMSVRFRAPMLVVILLAGGGCGPKPSGPGDGGADGSTDGATNDPSDSGVPGHRITSVDPPHGSLGARITITGAGFGSDVSALAVVFTTEAQGAMEVAPLSLVGDTLEVLVPSAVAEPAELRVTLAGDPSLPEPFTIDALVDPTPEAPGSEVESFYSEVDALLVGVTSVLTDVVAPRLEGAGQPAEAAEVRAGAADLRPAFAEVGDRLLTGQSAEALATMDAILASDAMVAARLELRDAAIALGVDPLPATLPVQKDLLAGWSGGTVESISQVRGALVRMRAALDHFDTVLLLAEVAAGAASVIPGFSGAASFIPILQEIRSTILKPIISLLDTVIPLLGIMPTRAMGNSFEVRVVANDLFLNQQFGSMADPIPAESDPGAFLVLEPFGLKGYVSFENDGGKSLQNFGDELAPGLSRIGEALLKLSGFDVGRIQVDSVEIKAKLISSDPSIVSGSFSDDVLWVEAAAPGLVTLTVRGDLANVLDSCPSIGDCIPAAEIEITRQMRAVSGDQTAAPASLGPLLISANVAGRPARTAHLGDTLLVTGAGFTRDPQLAHQDVHFEPAPGFSLSGLAWSTFQNRNGYDDFETEVPDALPGPMSVWVQGHPSNPLDFTILPPHLDQPPPSGIVGEFWQLTGEGFSDTPTHNQLDWASVRSDPEDGTHFALDLVVPDGGLSGPFSVVTLDALQSEAYDVVVRKFSEPALISAPGRIGLRPQVAHDATSGDRVAAWVDRNDKGAQQLVVAVAAAGAAQVGDPVVLPARLGGHAAAPPPPAVAAAGGHYFVAWVEAPATPVGHDRIFLAQSDDGQTWSSAPAFSLHTGPSRQPAIAAAGSSVVLAWVNEPATVGGDASLEVQLSSNSGASFPRGFVWNSADVSDPAVAVRGNAIAVAFSAADPAGRSISVTRSEDGGDNFQAPWRLGTTSSSGLARHPALALGPSCVTPSIASVYVAWEQSDSDFAEDVMFARIDGSVMAAHNVSQTPEHSQAPVLVVDDDCLPALAWLELGHSPTTLLDNGVNHVDQPFPASLIFARSFDAGATFNPRPQTLARLTDGSRLGHLAMAGGGSAVLTLVWQEDFGGAPVIAMRTTDGDGSSPATQPAGPAGEASADLVYRGHAGELWVSAPDGSQSMRVTRGRGTHNAPGSSPDARFIAYLPGTDRMLVSEADGAHPLGLVRTADFAWRGATVWSPRGDFVSVASPYVPATLGWVRPDSTGFQLVGAGGIPGVSGFTGLSPWSPGGELAYSTQDVLGRVDPASASTAALTAALPNGSSAYYPAWSPDGARLAFIVSSTAPGSWALGTLGTGNLYIYDVTLGTLVQLTDRGLDTTPVWSPDGQRIAFVRGSASYRQVHVQAIDGAMGSDRNVTANLLGADDVDPVFLPDGTGVVVNRRDPAGTDVTTVAIDIASLTVTVLAPAPGGSPAVAHLGARPVWAPNASASADITGTTSVGLSWQGASDDVGVDHFEIWNGDSPVVVGIAGNATSASVSGLTPDTFYTFTLRACDAAGNCSLGGPELSVTTASAGAAPTWQTVPPSLSSVQNGNYDTPYSVELEWTDVNEIGVEFRIFRDGALAHTQANSGHMAYLLGLHPETMYTASVQACFIATGTCTTDGPSYMFTTLQDTTPPSFQRATVLGPELSLELSEPLDETSIPDTGDFVVEVYDAALGATVPRTVSSVAVEELTKRVVLTLAQPVYAEESAYVAYVPGSMPIQNAGCLPAAEITTTAAFNGSGVEAEGADTNPAGDLVLAGTFSGWARFGSHALTSDGFGDAFVARRSAAGQWLWATRLGGPQQDAAYAAAFDGAGGVAVAGAFSGTVSTPGSAGTLTLIPNGASDAFVGRLDAAGDWQWLRRAGGVGTDMVVGGDSDVYNGGFVELAHAVAVDGAGNVYTGGRFGWTATFEGSASTLVSAGQRDIWVARLDPSGTVEWVARAGGDAAPAYWANETAHDLVVDGSGVYVTGAFANAADFPGLAEGLSVSFSPGSANPGLFVAKLAQADGAWLWADDNLPGSTIGNGGVGQAVAVDASGIYVGGSVSTFAGSPQPYVGKWDLSGTPSWSRTVNGYGSVDGLALDAAGVPFVAGAGGGGVSFDSTTLSFTDAFAGSLGPSDGVWTWALGDLFAPYYTVTEVVACGTGIACVVGTQARQAGQASIWAMFGTLNFASGGEHDMCIATVTSAVGPPPTGMWTALTSTADAP